MATTRRTKPAPKDSPDTAADGPAPKRRGAPKPVDAPPPSGERRAFALCGDIHWGYPFALALRGERKCEVEAFLTRFTSVAAASDRSGYLVHDDDDLAAAAKAFEQNRPAIPYACFLVASGRSLTAAERHAALDTALARPGGHTLALAQMLLATWPDDQDPSGAAARAGRAFEAWPRTLRYGTVATQAAAAAGDLGPHRAWVRSYGSKDLDADLARGMFERVEATQFDQPADLVSRVGRFEHLREIGLRGVPTAEAWESLRPLPHVERLAVWNFSGTSAAGFDAWRWRDAPLGRSLRVLETYGVKLTERDLAAFAAGPATLEHLKIPNARLTGAAVGRALAAIGARHPVRSLVAEYNELEVDGTAGLFEGASWRMLEALNLSANEIGDAGIAALARSPNLGRLRWFTCRNNAAKGTITAAGAAALADAASLDSLSTLGLMGHNLGTEGVVRLLSSPRLRALRRVNLSSVNADWGAVIEGLRGRETPALTHLDAGSWTAKGKIDWKAATFLRGVKHLRADPLPGNQYAGLLASGNLDALESLVLGGAYEKRPAAAKALLAAKALPRLKTLSLKGWRLGADEARALAASPLFAALPTVEVMASGYVSEAAALEFLKAGVRPVTSPEFDEYIFHDTPMYDFHVAMPEV